MALSLDGLSDEKIAAMNSALGELILPRTYVPVEPTLKQEWFLLQDALEVFFGGSAGPGKLLNCSTPVPTPTGWSEIGALAVGDEVLGEDGHPCRVEWLSDVDLRPDSYRLTFDDGSQVEACSDHLWLTFDADELSALTRRDPAWRARRRARRASRAVSVVRNAGVSTLVRERNRTNNPAVSLAPPAGTVRTTREIARTLTTPRGRRNHAIPVAAPLQLPEIALPLDPYVLGAWLGDGNTRDGHITSADPEVIFEIEAAGWQTRKVPSAQYGWRIVGLTTKLRELGILGNKHVPAAYLRSSASQRLALLQGLMDTDGYIDAAGAAQFTSTLPALADAVCELVVSLGMKAHRREARAKLNGRDCGPVSEVAFTPTLPVCRLSRKLGRIRPVTRRTTRFRYVVLCDPIPPVPMRCIRVSNPSSLFLVGRAMIPTHNSWGLLMAALQYVQWSGYHALLLRPSLTEFEQQGGLIELSHEWLGRSGAWWHGGRREWRFPAGSSVRFGYLANEADLSHYPGGGVSFLGFDELTLFTERLYLGMFRLLRQAKNTLEGVPVRVRSASNPGNIGHAFVKGRFIDPETREPNAVFVPATIMDNPHLDYDVYLETLSHMHPVDRERLVNGDWDVEEEGGKFSRSDFVLVEPTGCPAAVRAVRYWDLAATEPGPANPDPDFTVGLLMTLDEDQMFTIRDVNMFRLGAAGVEAEVRSQAEADRDLGIPVATFIEQDPGAAGKTTLGHYQRNVLQGFECYAGSTKVQGRNAAKEVRARPAAAAVGNHLVRLVRGRNFREFLGQCCAEGTLVFTAAGVKPIEQIAVGDRVLTHAGRFQRVLARQSRWAESVVTVRAKTLGSLTTTSDHPVLALGVARQRQPLDVSWQPAGELQVRAAVARNRGPEPSHLPHDALTLPMLRTVGAVEELDFASCIQLPSERNGRNGILVRGWRLLEHDGLLTTTHARSGNLARYMPLDKGTGRLLGLYLAEGNARPRGSRVSWSFSNQEHGLHQEVVGGLAALGLRPRIHRVQNTCTQVIADSSLLVQVLAPLGLAHEKRLPEWAWGAPAEFLEGVVEGWLDGDGHQAGSARIGTTVSPSLAWQMRIVLLALGHHANVRCYPQRAYNIRGRVGLSRPRFVVEWREKASYSVALRHGGFFGYSVRSIEEAPPCTVYDLDVESDESYVTTGGIVHNCAMFPHPSAHDDCVDAFSGAHTGLTRNVGGPMRIASPVGSSLRVPLSTDRQGILGVG